MLNGVDIKKSCFTEVNINIQPFALLKQFYTLYYRKHKRPHAAAWFSVHIYCTTKSVTQRHAAVSIIQLRLTVNDLEFSAYLHRGQANV